MSHIKTQTQKSSLTPARLRADLDKIKTAARPELIALWQMLLDSLPPKGLSQPLMRSVLVYEVQARAHKVTQRKVDRVLSTLRTQTEQSKRNNTANSRQRNAAKPLKAGSQILREWNGVTHKVEVLDSGYRWQNKTYKSLSAIAKAITGAHWSGPMFFGLKRNPKFEQYAIGSSAEKNGNWFSKQTGRQNNNTGGQHE